MKCVYKQYRYFLLVSSMCSALVGLAQKKEVEEDLSKVSPDRIPQFEEPAAKPVTQDEKNKNCQRYQNKIIAYTQDLYYVTSQCQRQLLSHEQAVNRLAEGEVPQDIDGRVIQSFPLKQNASKTIDARKKIKNDEGQCITHDQEVYKVEKGKKRLYPDWESVKASKCTLRQLTQEELDQIPTGTVLPSVLDQEQVKEIESVDRDLIPADKLCDYLPNTWYSLNEKLFEKKKNKMGCYLQEVRVDQTNDRLKRILSTTKPIELNQQLFRSVTFMWLPSSS